MKVFLLAAGFGTRLKPLTDTTPKPLLPLLNRPILEWMIARFESLGFSNFVINSHYLPEAIRRFSEDYGQSSNGGKIKISYEPEIKGTGGAIVAAKTLLFADKGLSDCLVHNGDILSCLDFVGLKDFHLQQKPMVTLSLRSGFSGTDRVVWAESLDGLLYVREISRRSIDEVSLTWRNIRPYSFLASYCANSSIMDHLSPHGLFDLIEGINSGLSAGKTVLGYECHDFWEDVGNPLILLNSNLALVDELRRKLRGLSPNPRGSLLESCPIGFIEEFSQEALLDHCVFCPKDDWRRHKSLIFKGFNVIGKGVHLGEKGSELNNCLVLNNFEMPISSRTTYDSSILGPNNVNVSL